MKSQSDVWQKRSELYPREMDYLPPKFAARLQEEIRETKKRREMSLCQIRELIQNDPKLMNSWFRFDYLLQYLRGKKYDVEKAFDKVKKFVSFVRRHSSYFSPITSEGFEKFINENFLSLLPVRDKEGCVILWMRLGKWDPSEVPVADLLRMLFRMITYTYRDPMTQINGFKMIYDFDGSELKYVRYFMPYYVSIYYQGTQVILPVKCKGIHVMNPSFVFRIGYAVLLPLISDKLRKRIYVHNCVEELQEHFPKSMIPVQYGGELEEYDFREYAEKCRLPDVVRHIVDSE